MSYKKVEPWPENKMARKRYEGHHTICQMLREIWKESDNDEIRLKARIAMSMAKKMHKRLQWYKENYIDRK